MNKIIGLNEMFGIPDAQFEVVELPINELSPRRDHKFSPSSESKRQWIKESIQEFGVLEPILVRPKEDCEYDIAGKYEILAGHQRTELSKELGNKTVPALIKTGLKPEEAEQIVTETNVQRDWNEMRHSERAAVISSHYNAQKRSAVRTQVLDEINNYLKTFANPVNSMAEGEVSTGWTDGVRSVANDFDLSKSTIAMYVRIDTLIESVKLLLDDKELSIKAAVELSYTSQENQELLVKVMNEFNLKCDVKKAKAIRELQTKGKLNEATMVEVLSGSTVKKKPGKPKGYKVSPKIIQKYFTQGENEKEIGDIIEAALEQYFREN